MKIYKIFDYGCPVCEFMTTFDDSITFNLNPRPEYSVILLGDLLNSENAAMQYLARLVEVHACNPDYTLDLPAYMVLEGKNYVGHVVGEQTANELKTKLEGFINGKANTQSQSNLPD
jgi:hypothetical protein